MGLIAMLIGIALAIIVGYVLLVIAIWGITVFLGGLVDFIDVIFKGNK